MDRISDSGSDGCGSIPHGGTRTGRICGQFLFIPQSLRDSPQGHAFTSFGRSGRPFRLSVFCRQNTRISRESRLLNILNRRIFLLRNTYLSVKIALFPDGMLKLVSLSGAMADFPDESHNLR